MRAKIWFRMIPWVPIASDPPPGVTSESGIHGNCADSVGAFWGPTWLHFTSLASVRLNDRWKSMQWPVSQYFSHLDWNLLELQPPPLVFDGLQSKIETHCGTCPHIKFQLGLESIPHWCTKFLLTLKLKMLHSIINRSFLKILQSRTLPVAQSLFWLGSLRKLWQL